MWAGHAKQGVKSPCHSVLLMMFISWHPPIQSVSHMYEMFCVSLPSGGDALVMCRVGQNHIYTVFLAGTSPNIRSYTVYIYGSGQP